MLTLAPWIATLMVLNLGGGAHQIKSPESASDPVPVSEDDDTVNQNLERVVVVTLELDGQTLKQVRSQIMSLPLGLSQRAVPVGAALSPPGMRTVEVQALRKAKGQLMGLEEFAQVPTTTAPYEQLNVAEHRGLVTIRPRAITVALAVRQPVDTLSIKLPARANSYDIDLTHTVRRFCANHQGDAWCPPGGPGSPPQ